MIFVVAEIGVNWDGDFDLARDMMTAAKEAGCNAVKFQAFEDSMVKNHPQATRLIKSTISKKNIETINELAKLVGIEWFCTPMYPEAVEMLDPFVKRFKIRVVDSEPLLENKSSKLFDAVLKTDKEIIVSCRTSPRGTKYYNYPNIRWLYCVPKYPCDFVDLDFRHVKDFDGYSNHCPHFLAPLTAIILGSKIIEVHITSDKSKDFVDNNVSLDYTELKEFVKLAILTEKISR